MRKVFFLVFFLPFTACKKNTNKPMSPPTPDITESLSLSIVNQNPDKYDSARGHVADTFSWSIPHAYGDTCMAEGNGIFVLPSNAGTLILEGLIYAYGTGGASIDQLFLSVNNGADFSTVGLTIGFPLDTANVTLGYNYGGFSGGSITFADTVAVHRTYGVGLSRMINWWRGDAVPVNDSVTKYVNINTNPLALIVQDSLVFTSKSHVGDELVVSGTFSNKIYVFKPL